MTGEMREDEARLPVVEGEVPTKWVDGDLLDDSSIDFRDFRALIAEVASGETALRKGIHRNYR